MKLKISAVIVARNEEKIIAKAIKTLLWCDEVLVIDTGSSDKTKQVSLDASASRVITYKTNDMAAARNFGLLKTKNDWVLFVDADEVVTKDLETELKESLRNKLSTEGYLIQRIDLFKGKKMLHGEPGNTWLVRFGKKNAGLWKRPIHECWNITNTKKLRSPLFHSPHDTYLSFKQTVEDYAYREAVYKDAEAEEWNIVDQLGKPVAKFIVNYFGKLGFLDGFGGLVYALMMSYHSFLVRRHMFNLQFLRKAFSVADKTLLGLHGVVLVLMMGGQLSRGQISQGVAVYLFEVLMLVVVLFTFKKFGVREKSFWEKAESRLFALFYGIAMVSLLGPSLIDFTRSIVGWLYWVRLGLYATYGWSLYQLAVSLVKPRLLLQGLALLGLSLVLGGLGQYFLMPDTRFLRLFGWDDHYFRAIGQLYDPSFLGLMAILNAAIWSLFALPYWRMVGFLSTATLLLTYARSAYFVFVAGLVILALVGWRRKLVTVLVGVFAVAVFLLPRPGGEGVRLERTVSIGNRVESNLNAWELFLERPVVGWGFGQYKTQLIEAGGEKVDPLVPVHTSGPDNSFLLVMVGTGVLGLLAYAIWVGRVVRFSRKELGVWLPLTLILLHSLTNNSFFYPWVMVWWWALTAYSLRLTRSS